MIITRLICADCGNDLHISDNLSDTAADRVAFLEKRDRDPEAGETKADLVFCIAPCDYCHEEVPYLKRGEMVKLIADVLREAKK